MRIYEEWKPSLHHIWLRCVLVLKGDEMTEEKPTYITDHEAKRRRIEAIKAVLARYAAGEIGQEQATAEIEAITHEK